MAWQLLNDLKKRGREEKSTLPEFKSAEAVRLEPLGAKRWAIAEGSIPAYSHGPEPQFTSHETVCLLNTTERAAHVSMTIFYAHRDPAGPYRVTVAPRRTKPVRFNDLTAPEPSPVDTDFASAIEAAVPGSGQHTRLASRQAENALLSTIAYAER